MLNDVPVSLDGDLHPQMTVQLAKVSPKKLLILNNDNQKSLILCFSTKINGFCALKY